MIKLGHRTNMQVDGPPRGRGRPNRTWMEIVTIDLMKYNISKDLG